MVHGTWDYHLTTDQNRLVRIKINHESYIIPNHIISNCHNAYSKKIEHDIEVISYKNHMSDLNH